MTDSTWNSNHDAGIPPPPPPPPPASASPPSHPHVIESGNHRHGHGESSDDDGGDFDPVMGAADAALARTVVRSNGATAAAAAAAAEETKLELNAFFAAEASPPPAPVVDDQDRDGGAAAAAAAFPPPPPPHGHQRQDNFELGHIDDDENRDPYSDTRSAAVAVAKKKPFLRKGSRREPTSLHRFRVQSAATAAAGEAAAESPSSSSKDTEKKKEKGQPSSLEALEKMQQDQMDDLERRMARRREAREQQKMQQQKVQQQQEQRQRLGQERVGNGTGPTTTTTSSEKVVTIRAPYATDDSPASSMHVAGDEVRGPTPPTPRRTKSPAIDSGSRSATSTSITSKNTRGSGSRHRSNEKTQKGGRVPLRQKNGREASGGDASGSAAQTQRNEEQWNLLKSMRRRQEAALRDAEQERETVRSWAASERASVKKWADEQRALIRRERHRASTAAMASQRERQKEDKKQQDALTELEERSGAEIDALRATVEKLRTEAEGTKARYRMSERKLRDKIRLQSETIRQLQSKIESQPDAAVDGKPCGEKQQRGGKKNNPTAAVQMSQKESRAGSKSSSKKELRDFAEVPVRAEKDDGEEASSIPTQPNQDSHSTPEDVTANDAEAANLETKDDVDNQDGRGRIQQEQEGTSHHNVLEETTEQWVKRLEERHNAFPKTSNLRVGGTSGTIEYRDDASTPVLCEADGLLAMANQLMNGGGLPRSAESLYRKDATTVATFSGYKQPIAQHTPDPQSVSSLHIEGAGSEGRRIISYRNGTSKETFPDGTTKVYFVNGDVKTTYANQSVTVYYYAAAQTTHTTHADGLEVFEFPNKQTEKHYRDGKKEVFFPEGTVKRIDPDGSSETAFTDGVRILEMTNGTKQIIRG